MVLRPLGSEEVAAVQNSVKADIKNNPKIKAAMKKAKQIKASTKAFGYGGAYPYG
jgi:hypothetical protein